MSRFGRIRAGLGLAAAAALVAVGGATGAASAAPNGPAGIDVSHYQGSIDWSTVASSQKFAYVKVTEGTSIIDDQGAANYNGAYNAGLIRGAYHFAELNASGGKAQADYFLAHGGKWSGDGKTLPGVVDLESGAGIGAPECYGLSKADTVAWIHDFANEYKAKTTRDVVIYTGPGWWNDCTGGNGDFADTNPLWVADSTGEVPTGFSIYTFWQYGQGSVSGVSGSVDTDVFNGDAAGLAKLANG